VATHSELRVHGVSGTPPRDLLYSDPVTYDQTGTHTKVYRQTRSGGFDVAAFHWGSLTAGSWVTAFWVLLAPFAFANAAGWMLTSRGPWSRMWVRWAGLCLTGLLVAQGAVLLIDLPYHWIKTNPIEVPVPWLTGPGGRLPPGTVVVGVAALTVGFVFLVWRLSTRSHFTTFTGWTQVKLVFSPKINHLLPPRYWEGEPTTDTGGCTSQLLTEDEQWKDPGDEEIADKTLWQEHAFLHRLRRIHLGVGFAVVALSLAVGSQSLVPTIAAALPVVAGFTLLAVTGFRPTSMWVKRGTALSPLIGLAFLVLIGVAVLVGENALPAEPHWTGIHEVVAGVAGLLGITAFGTWLSQVVGSWSDKGIKSLGTGWVTLGALTIATLLGASFGMAAGLVAENWLGVDEITDNGGGWVATAMLLLVIWLLGATGIAILWGKIMPQEDVACGDYPISEAPANGRNFALIRRVTRRASWIFTAAGIYGIVAGVTAAIDAWIPGSFALSPMELSASGAYLTVAAVFLGTFGILVLTIALFEYNGGVALGILLVGTAILAAARFELLPEFSVLGAALDLSSLVDVGKLLLIVGPAALVARGILSRSLGGADKRRRGVGVLWDVGSLWPRWFHPLGPPSYGPNAVCQLLDQIRGDERPDVLAAHSQGSLISAIAISQADPAEVSGMGFLTYGSPLGLLYSRLFPAVGIDGLVTEVQGKLGRPWINLWRDTDYLGGCPIGLGAGDRKIATGAGHSLYELTFEFCSARREAVNDPVPDGSDCW